MRGALVSGFVWKLYVRIKLLPVVIDLLPKRLIVGWCHRPARAIQIHTHSPVGRICVLAIRSCPLPLAVEVISEKESDYRDENEQAAQTKFGICHPFIVSDRLRA